MVNVNIIVGVVITLLVTKDASGDYCTDQPSYQKLKNDLRSNPCMTDATVFHELHQIKNPECRHRFAAEINQIIGDNAVGSQCECHGHYNHLQITGQDYRTASHCGDHYNVWKDFELIPYHSGHSSHYCNWDLLQRIDGAISHDNSNTCTCTKKTNQATSSDRCTSQPAYQKLQNDLKSDPCMTDAAVLHELHNISHPECRHQFAAEINKIIGDNPAGSQCECQGHYNSLHIRGQNSHTSDCGDHYNTIINHYTANSNQPQCSTHHFLWDDYKSIPSPHNGQSHLCNWDLLQRIDGAISHNNSNTCTCNKKTYQVKCDPVKSLTGVALNQAVGNKNCPTGGGFSTSLSFVEQACGMEHSAMMKVVNGGKVKDQCNTLPHYTAVAKFKDGHVVFDTHDSSGVFIGCATDYIKIITEDCHSNLHVKHVPMTSPEADEYLVVIIPH